jgi:hypothetical protein
MSWQVTFHWGKGDVYALRYPIPKNKNFQFLKI